MAETKKPIPFAPGWNQFRWEQLFALEKLLREIRSINHGSGALERIQECIAIAEALDSDLVRDHDCTALHTFLKERALGK